MSSQEGGGSTPSSGSFGIFERDEEEKFEQEGTEETEKSKNLVLEENHNWYEQAAQMN